MRYNVHVCSSSTISAGAVAKFLHMEDALTFATLKTKNLSPEMADIVKYVVYEEPVYEEP